MKRGALGTLLLLGLAGEAVAQDQSPVTLPFRGTLRVLSAVSQTSAKPFLQKLFPLLEGGTFKIDDARLDYVGLSDESRLLSSDGWLAYRGAQATFSEARPQLTSMPGFEWKGGSRTVSIYGADHKVAAAADTPEWPALRVGRLAADIPAESLNNALYSWMRRGLLLSQPSALYQEALATDLFAGTQPGMSSLPPDLLVLEKPSFLPDDAGLPTGGYNLPNSSTLVHPPVESIWGRPSTELAARFTATAGQTVAQDRQSFGLARMGNLADMLLKTPMPATDALPLLQDVMLRKGDPPDQVTTRIPLVPGFSTKMVEAGVYNVQYQKIYAEYYTLLAAGLTFFQSYGGASGAGSATALEGTRTAWLQGTSDQQAGGQPGARQPNWDPDLLTWLNNYDPQQPLVAALNSPLSGGPQAWLVDLDPRKLKNRSLTRDRIALMELGFGQTDAEARPATSLPTAGGGGGGSYIGIENLKHYYNLALRNGWHVAPCTGLANVGGLATHTGKTLPRARACFTGVYPGPDDAAVIESNRFQLDPLPGRRCQQLFQQGFARRRTFVSEHPYIDAQFYARDLGGGRTVAMGGDLFKGNPGAQPTTFELTLKLDVPVKNQHTDNLRLKMADIRLVEIVEREHLWEFQGTEVKIVDLTRKASAPPEGDVGLSRLVADEIPVLPYYTRAAVSQPGTSGGISTVLHNYGIGGTFLDPGDPTTYPLPLTLTWRITARPHTSGGTMGYYALVKLPAFDGMAGSLVTAPLWTVTNWSGFASRDESL